MPLNNFKKFTPREGVEPPVRFRITGFQDQPSTIVASRHLLDGDGVEPSTHDSTYRCSTS